MTPPITHPTTLPALRAGGMRHAPTRSLLAAVAATLLGAAACNPDRATAPATEPSLSVAAETASVAVDSVASHTIAATIISDTTPHYLKASQGNLYWTRNTSGGLRSEVWRTSKTSRPGEERLLYAESAPAGRTISFEGLTYAYVDGDWYGYFVACTTMGYFPRTRTCNIRKLPLAGGTPKGIGSSIGSVPGQVETDGTYLYWPDALGIRRMPIGGGTATLLVSASGVRGISLTGTHIYFVRSSGVFRIRKSGGYLQTLASGGTGYSQVLAFETPSGVQTVFWAEGGAWVRSRTVASTVSVTVTWMPRVTGRVATAIGYDGTNVIVTDCAGSSVAATVPGTCQLRMRGGLKGALLTVRSGLAYAGMLQWDPSAVFYRNGTRLERVSH